MKRTISKAILLALPLTFAVPALAAPPEEDGAGEDEGEDAGAGDDISEEEALEDDILLVIDLPVAADDAREAGVEEAELDEALDAGEAGAISPGTMTEIIDDEAEQTRGERGKKKAFGQWVKMQIAAGIRGKELAAKIEQRKEELADMSDEEKAELEAKIKELGEKHRKRRKALHAKRKELREQGKEIKHPGKERHEKMLAKAAKRHEKAKKDFQEAKKAHKMDKREDKMDKREDKMEKREDKMDERDDKMDEREDKMEKRDEKMEKREDKLDKREDHKGGPGKKGK